MQLAHTYDFPQHWARTALAFTYTLYVCMYVCMYIYTLHIEQQKMFISIWRFRYILYILLYMHLCTCMSVLQYLCSCIHTYIHMYIRHIKACTDWTSSACSTKLSRFLPKTDNYREPTTTNTPWERSINFKRKRQTLEKPKYRNNKKLVSWTELQQTKYMSNLCLMAKFRANFKVHNRFYTHTHTHTHIYKHATWDEWRAKEPVVSGSKAKYQQKAGSHGAHWRQAFQRLAEPLKTQQQQ